MKRIDSGILIVWFIFVTSDGANEKSSNPSPKGCLLSMALDARATGSRLLVDKSALSMEAWAYF